MHETSSLPADSGRPATPQSVLHAESLSVADRAVSDWKAVHAALSPIVGHRGVAALYKRSLTLASAEHGWLAAAQDESPQPADFAALHAALSRQGGVSAAAAAVTLMHTFRSLVGKLIGASLIDRLLQPATDPATGGTAAQDNAP